MGRGGRAQGAGVDRCGKEIVAESPALLVEKCCGMSKKNPPRITPGVVVVSQSKCFFQVLTCG